MAGGQQSGAERRYRFMVDERRAGKSPRRVGLTRTDEAADRLDLLHEYRRRQSEAEAARRRRTGRGRAAGLTASTIGQNWVPIGPAAVLRGQASTLPVVSGRVQDLAVSRDGRRVYAATANGGVWRTIDGGDSWDPMSDEFDIDPQARQVDSLACGAIALVEGADAAHDRLYVGTGEGHAGFATGSSPDFFGVGMLRSDDGGGVWIQEPSAPNLLGSSVYAIAVDPTDPEHAVAATTRGVYRRTAAVPTWTEEGLPVLGTGRNVTGVTVGRNGNQTEFYVVVSGGRIFQWAGTLPWTELTGFPAGAGRCSIAATATDPPVIYVLSAKGANPQFGKFHGLNLYNLGRAAPIPWEAITGAPDTVFGDDHFQGSYDQALTIDPNNPDICYIGGSGLSIGGEFTAAIYRIEVDPTAGGPNPCKSTLIGGGAHADVHALLMRPGSSTELWAGSDGGVWRTTDAKGPKRDQVFLSRNIGLATLTLMGLDHHPSEESYAFCGAQDNGGLRYQGDEVWDHQLYGDGGDTVIDWNTGERLLSIYTSNRIRRAKTDGSRYSADEVGPTAAAPILFYPPLVGTPPSANATDADVVALGAEDPWVSTNFGGSWTVLPTRGAPGQFVRSLAFASPSLLWAGWVDGHVARFDLTAPGWANTPLPRAGETRPVTSISIDPADATGRAIFVTLGGGTGAGDRVWHLDSAGNWTSAGNGLLDVQANCLAIDPANANRRWVATDLGVWQWDTTGPGQWQPFSFNLPDAAVLDIDLLPGGNLLRASTYGRGVWELDLATNPTRAVELVVRTNRLDARRRAARAGVKLPGDLGHKSTLDESPDIIVDAPNNDGVYALDPARTPNIVQLLGHVGARKVLASVPEAPAVTRVHVVVRNRGVRPANPALDAVRVALLVGPAGDNDETAPSQLPAGFAEAARAGTAIDADGWKTVGIRTLNGLKVGRPGVATFELSSTVLPVADDAAGKRFVLLALVHHDDDAFPAGASRDPVALATNERRAALRRVTVERAKGRAAAGSQAGGAGAGGPVNPAGGTGLLVPVTAALLAHQRLGDIADQLERKINASRVTAGFTGVSRNVVVNPVERRVFALVSAARDAMRAGPPAAVPRHLPGTGIGSYALLGAIGFELPGFTSILAPGGAWVADYMRRGSPDVNRSLVKVPSSEFPLAVGRIGVADAGADAALKQKITAFSTGMLAGAAAGIAVGPQLADLLASDSNQDWHRHSASSGAAGLERHLRRRFLGGDDRASTLATWLPAAGDVPPVLWEAYVKAMAEVYALPAQRVKGFPAFESDFDPGDAITGVRLKNAYGLVLDDLRTSSWPWPAWWGLISPILLAPSFAMLIARELPHAKAFFEDGAKVTERSVFELLTVSMGLGSLAPFVYSMILWSAVDEHTEAFVNALLIFLTRAGLVAGSLATAGDEDQSELTRWLGLFAPLAGLDIYAAIRAAVAGKRRPGVATVFALQTIPALTGLATLGVTALLKLLGISDDWPFWLAWILHTLGVWLGIGIPVAIALSNGGGWRSWFMRDDRHFPLLSSVAAAGVLPAEPIARARVFDASALWPDPAVAAPADLSAFAYPSGMRPLVKVWFKGEGNLEVRRDNDLVTLRLGAAETPVRLPPGSTAASLVTALEAALGEVKAKAVSVGSDPASTLDPALPWPRSLADPGDAGPAADAVVARSRFVPVGNSEAEAVVLAHAPRTDLSTPLGLDVERAEAFPVIPVSSLGDLEGSGLGNAADLAALLAAAAAPSFAPVAVADALPPLAAPAVNEVVQVFRRWNLDERRLEEWQALMSGGAPVEGPAAPEPLVRTPPGGYGGAQPVGADLAAAMGWIPLWRAWLRIASDPNADAAAPFAAPTTPLVRFADGSVRRPSNAQLTEGVRFLLDLGGGVSAESEALAKERIGLPGRPAPEHDEIRGRATSFPGPAVFAPEEAEELPLGVLSQRTATPRIAAGPRASRPAAATLGADASTRHNWSSIGPRNIAGRLRAVACADPGVANPTTWYAASAGGGVWKTTNGGRRWTALWHDQPCLEVGALAIAPGNAQRVYAATGEAVPASHISVRSFGVFVTSDAGASWTNHGTNAPNPDAPRGFEAIAVDPADERHCWAVGPDGAFRTLDAGEHWDRLDVGVHYTDVAFAGARLFLVRGTSRAGEGAVVRLATPKTATDADLQVAASTSVVVPARAAHLTWPVSGKIAVVPSNNAVVYTRWAGEDGKNLGIFRSTNAGAANTATIAWTRLPDDAAMREEEQGDYDLCIAVDPTDPSNVVTGQQLYVFASTNADTANAANVTWRRIMSWELRNAGLEAHQADHHHIVLTGNPVECWIAGDGGIARSTDWATGVAPIHGARFLPDPARPVPPGAVRWQKRDHGIVGAQFYDITQNSLIPGVVAGGLQDNGTVLRPGGLTWQRVFVADGGHATFDPDDPYRLNISYFAGLVALQFPALLDRLFAGSPTEDDSLTFRFVDGDVTDGSPFVPETERHPTRTGRLLHARDGRVWGLRPGQGDTMTEETLGRSFEMRFRPPVPPPPDPTDVTVGDTPGAWRLGLVPGRYVRRDRSRVALFSRAPAPFRLAEGDTLALTVNGTAFVTTFNAAAGIDPAAVTVADVIRLVDLAVPAAVVGRVAVHPYVWEAPSAILLVAHDPGPPGPSQIQLGGTALAPLADGLSRLGLNAGTYVGEPHGTSLMLGFAGFDRPERLLNRDLRGAPAPELQVAVNGRPAVSIPLGPTFADAANVTTGELASALKAGLAAEPIDVHAVALVDLVVLRANPGRRVRLTGTAADRLASGPNGAAVLTIGFRTLAARHAGNHVRNRGSLDLTPPAAAPLELVIGDGVANTAPLRFTAANCAALRSVTSEELHRLIAAHLAAHPAVQVSVEQSMFPLPGAASEIRFSPVNDDEIWVGLPDGSVLRTVDDGITWTDVTDPQLRAMHRQVEAIAFHPTDAGTVYIGLVGEGAASGDPGFLFKTTTSGPPWNQIGFTTAGGVNTGIVTDGRPLGVSAIEIDPVRPDVVYVATEAGVFRSPDAGVTWAPFGEGLPNVPVVDLAIEPVNQRLRAALWTRGVQERRLDATAPDDARLVIRATALDDGQRPARAAPSFHTSAPAPVLVDSPDIKHVARRPDIGGDADVDGVAFDLLVANDDIIGGTTTEVMVQVANLGALAVPPGSPPPPGDRARVVVLWAPVDGGVPPLPGDIWMRLTAGPLVGAVGGWTLLGDDAVPRIIGPGDSAVKSFGITWPALDGVGRIGLLALATAVADPIPAGPLDVSALVGVERRAAYREVLVHRVEDERTLLLRSTKDLDIIVDQAAPPEGTGVADRLGFAAGVIGVGGRVRVAAAAGAATYNLAVAGPAPGPAIVLRTAVPIAADLAMLPAADEADDPAAVTRAELAAMINVRATAIGLPIEAFNPGVAVAITSNSGVTFRVTGGNAAARLGLAVGGAAADFAVTNRRVAWFDLTGTPALNLEFVLPGAANVVVAVDLAAQHFRNVAVADPEVIAAVIGDALANAQLGALTSAFAIGGLAVRGNGLARVQLSGAAAAAGACDFPAAADRVVVSIPAAVDLTAGPNLHVDVTPRVVVRFDADPADIPNLAAATPADVRRAINAACEQAGVPAQAEIPRIELRLASSPGDVGRRHPILGGAQLAELAVLAVGQATTADVFALRSALGADVLETGVNNRLALRVRNVGNLECATARVRLFSLNVGAAPVTANPAADATGLVVGPGATLIHEMNWDPGGAAPRTEVVMVVADDDRDGRRIDVPASFPTLEAAIAFASGRRSVALRTVGVKDP